MSKVKGDNNQDAVKKCMDILAKSDTLALIVVLKTKNDEKGHYVSGFTIDENIVQNFNYKSILINIFEEVKNEISSDDYPSHIEKDITL